jgi:hypothetical protein
VSTAGQPHELARYTLPDGNTRTVVAQRIDGRVALSDIPTGDTGRVYLIERHVTSRDEMDGIVAAYIDDCHRRREPAAPCPADLELDRAHD